MREPKVIMFDSDEAAKKVTVTGWLSSTGLFFGDGAANERTARYAGSTHRLCEDCGTKVIEKHRVVCDGCKDVRDLAKYLKMETEEYNGETPVYSDAYDRYFMDAESLTDFIEEEEIVGADDNAKYEAMRLIICKPILAHPIDPVEHYCDDLPEDPDESCLPSEIAKAFDDLNEVIKNCTTPLSWYPGKKRAVAPVGNQG